MQRAFYNVEMEVSVSVVEDDAPSRRMMVGWINKTEGFQCISNHASGEAALKELPDIKPEVVLMDINLPGMNGMECVSRLKPLLPDTQFVMLTVYEDSDHIFRALQSGATGYLLKETPRSELFDALREVHRGGSPMTSNIARKVVRSFQVPPADPAIEDLSTREREVLELLARGYLYKEIADALKISVPTVNTYIRRIYEKLHVRSRAQAVAKYSHGLPPSGRRLDRDDRAS
jgi:DNA-binding NarL/FixJ family response regulator